MVSLLCAAVLRLRVYEFTSKRAVGCAFNDERAVRHVTGVGPVTGPVRVEFEKCTLADV
jgi:hypothetical protein